MTKQQATEIVAAERPHLGVSMSDLVTITCGKCGGTGTIRAFAHIQGGQCFACKGVGHFTRTAASVARSERRAAQRRAETLRAVEEGNRRADAREALYADDARLGPRTRERVTRFPAVAYETYATLAKIDAGELTREKHPWVFRNLAE